MSTCPHGLSLGAPEKPYFPHVLFTIYTRFFQFYTGLSGYGFQVLKIFGVFPMMDAWLYEWAYIGTCS